jgi:hypothetical protein
MLIKMATSTFIIKKFYSNHIVPSDLNACKILHVFVTHLPCCETHTFWVVSLTISENKYC